MSGPLMMGKEETGGKEIHDSNDTHDDDHQHEIVQASNEYHDGMIVNIDAKGMEILLQQNSQLEIEVIRLCAELDELSKGVLKRGYLFKQRDRNISFSSKWGLRYFELIGSNISYFIDDRETRPRRTIDISHCTVVDEGEKKGRYFVFSLLLENSIILRLSSDNRAEAWQWVQIIEKACKLFQANESISLFTSSTDAPKNVPSVVDLGLMNEEQMKAMTAINPSTLLRVQSSSLILEKAKSFGSIRSFGSGYIIGDDLQRHPHPPTIHPPTIHQPHLLHNSPKLIMRKPKPAPNLLPKTGKEGGIPSHLSDFPASMPIHCENRPSPLSSDEKQSQQNFRGFFNLGVIILFISHCRQVVSNMKRHGLLISFEDMYPTTSIHTIFSFAVYNTTTAFSFWIFSIYMSFGLEVCAARNYLKEGTVLFLTTVLGSMNIIVPCLWVWKSDSHPMLSILFLGQSVIMWMKLISYAHVNRDLRRCMNAQKKKKDQSTEDDHEDDEYYNNAKPQDIYLTNVRDLNAPIIGYPQNITLSNLLYFLIVPTLCYQLNYPRSPKIRWRHVLSLVFRLLLCISAQIFAFQQYVMPTLQSSIVAVKDRNVIAILERLLNLSIPNTYIWLLLFYWYFHVWLNLLAELTRFGDRLFYKDWWNARTIDLYWRNWNLPVHSWCLRHIYHPLLRAKVSKGLATFAVFLFSAIMHEVCLSIPFKHLRYHAFFGMLAQAPLVYITRYIDRVIDNAFFGNVFFWCAFCVVGQPMGVILYYFDIWKISHQVASAAL